MFVLSNQSFIAGISRQVKKILSGGQLVLFLLIAPDVSLASELIEFSLHDVSYQIEIAQTPAQRRLGLMHRSRLAANHGMLLVYQRTGNHQIWMKNVLIPLRVYWLDEKFTVIHNQRLEPCRQSPCPTYGAPRPSRYVLELSDTSHRLETGDSIDELRNLPFAVVD